MEKAHNSVCLVKQIVLVKVNQKAMILEKDSMKNTAQMF